jgi:predicted nucleotidyltransferase
MLHNKGFMKPPSQLYCVENIIKVLAEESDILFAFLFGSYAKGTQDKKKTVDVRILNDSKLRFRSQVLRFGKLLHSKDEKKRIEFETSSLLQYYDFKPHLEMYAAARRVRLGI